jgi:hypothetical protein
MPPGPPSDPFPRRALIVSVHDYLYANPVMPGGDGENAVAELIPALQRGLNVPPDQIYHVSDAAGKNPLPPFKSVIERAVVNFLKTSRDQDRVLLVFIGHATEIHGESYLVPLEGDLSDPATLIPLWWVYEQLEGCKARQKILVLDGNRSNAAQGRVRPTPGEMGARFEAALKAPPAGVEVWSACSAKQFSHEFDGAPLGVFLDNVRQVLLRDDTSSGNDPDALIPLESLQAAVRKSMDAVLVKRRASQKAFVAGAAMAKGAPYDPDAPRPQEPDFPVVKPPTQQAVQGIFGEVSMPAVNGPTDRRFGLILSSLPFDPKALKAYQGAPPEDSRLVQAIRKARLTLWLASPTLTVHAPSELRAGITALRHKQILRDTHLLLRGKYLAPGSASAEIQFKKTVFEDSKELGRVAAVLEDAYSELREAEDELEKAPPRWQANYLYVKARVQTQLVYLEESAGLLGNMRKELPLRDPALHTGWRMASVGEPPRDGAAKKFHKQAMNDYSNLAKRYQGTPWAVLGKREGLTVLGLDWMAE